ncbi:peroxynitrite isomerase THAP4-like [Rhincodon typus]|uniref:peroxynitrite isomerase THAP4-like n=1 Tax=Rhincodon typus TaxID=259920 RepID=UPI0020305C41|nr:peroxynitrite isomerase THAP4-like [Rhincodon typus]
MGARFPLKDAKRLAEWIAAVGRTDWKPTKFSFLCSAHFTKDSFQERQEDQCHRLKFNAVPSIFHFSENQRKVERGHTHCQVAAKLQLAAVNQERTLSGCLASEALNAEHLESHSVIVDNEHVLETVSGLEENGAVLQSSSVTAEPVVCMVSEQQCCSKSDSSPQPASERLLIDGTVPFPDDAAPSASGACKLINSLHSYCLSPTHSTFLKDQVTKKNTKLKLLRQQSSRVVKRVKRLEGLIHKLQETNSTLVRCFLPQDHVVPLNPAIEPLSWMLGSWISEMPGEGSYPTIKPFKYMEEVQITHVGQPMLNISNHNLNSQFYDYITLHFTLQRYIIGDKRFESI